MNFARGFRKAIKRGRKAGMKSAWGSRENKKKFRREVLATQRARKYLHKHFGY